MISRTNDDKRSLWLNSKLNRERRKRKKDVIDDALRGLLLMIDVDAAGSM